MKAHFSSYRSWVAISRRIKERSVAGLLGLALLFAVDVAAAESATITMKSGEVTQAEVLALEFGKQVRVKLSDGTEKVIPWSEVRDVQMNSGDAEADTEPAGEVPLLEEKPTASEPAEAPAPVEESTPKVAPAPAPTAAKPDKSMIYSELALVERDITDAKANMPVIGGPLTLTLIGLGVGAAVIASTVNAESNCGSYCDLGPSYGIGVFNLGVGAIGAIWLGAQVAARGKQKDRIGQLEARREQLRLDLQTSRSGAVGSISLTF